MAAEETRTPEQIATAEMTKFTGGAFKDGEPITKPADNMTQEEKDHAAREAAVKAQVASVATDDEGKKPGNDAAAKTPAEVAKAAVAAARGDDPEGEAEEERGEEVPEPEEVEEEPTAARPSKSARKPDAERRIQSLTEKWRGEQRAREAMQAELDRLKMGLANPQPRPQVDAAGNPIDRNSPDYIPQGMPEKPSATKFEYGEFDARYAAALAGWEARRVNMIAREESREETYQHQVNQARQQVANKITKIVEEGVAKYPDLPKVIREGQEGKWPLSEPLGGLILSSDHAADIVYSLGTDLAEASRVASLSTTEQAAWFGRMEAYFEAASSSQPLSKPAVKVSKAPPPVKPPRGHGGNPAAVRADTNDFAAFERLAMSKSK